MESWAHRSPRFGQNGTRRLTTGWPRIAEEETAKALAKNSGQPVIWITGVDESNEHSFAGKKQKNVARIYSDYVGSRKAYEMAGIKNPLAEIEIVEVHDASIHQLLITMGEMGFIPLGKTSSFIDEGIIASGGKLLCQPCGGLVYSGHAVGTSNIMSAWSGRNELIRRGKRRALVHGTGIMVSKYTVVMILEQE